MQDLILKIRKLNRLYLPAMHLLDSRYLGSEFSITEARIFFEIYEHAGCRAVEIVRRLNIDKSYLSRILNGFEKKGYLVRQPSEADRRCYGLYLTSEGKAQTEKLIALSNRDIAGILSGFSQMDLTKIEEAVETLTAVFEREEAEK